MQRTGNFKVGGKWAQYWGLTWDELLDLVLIGEIDEDEAEQIYNAQQPRRVVYVAPPVPPPVMQKKGGCECDDVDREIARYRRLREERGGGANPLYRFHRGRHYWRYRGRWRPLYGLSYSQMLAYGVAANLARQLVGRN